jgi:hypothetical protein
MTMNNQDNSFEIEGQDNNITTGDLASYAFTNYRQ